MARSRLPRLILLSVAAMLVLLAGAALLLPALLLDQASLKPRIAATVQAATGRSLTLTGPLTLHLLPEPSVTMEDVSFANRQGGSDTPMLKLGRLEARLAWRPLLQRQVEIARLELVRPEILLEIGADGGGNWQFTPPGAAAQPPGASPAAPPPASQGGAGFTIALREMAITDGHITWHDARTNQSMAIEVPSLTIDQPGPGADLTAKGTLRQSGTDITLDVETGPIERLQSPPGAGGAPWPVRAAIQAGAAQFSAQGSVADPVAATGLALALTAEAPSLDKFPFTPGAALPAWGPVKLATQLRITRPGAPIELPGLSLTTPGGTLTGDLVLSQAPRMKLSGTLAAERLDVTKFDQLRAPAPGNAQIAPPAPPPAPVRGATGSMIPDTPLDFAALRQMDADLGIKIGTLVLPTGQIGAIDTHLGLDDGQLNVKPLAATLDNAPISGAFAVNAAATPPAVGITLQGTGLRVEKLLALAGQPAEATGALDLDVQVTGAGETPHAIAGTLDGVVALGLSNGSITIGNRLGAVAGTLQKAGLPGQKLGAGRTDLRCLALRAELAQGTAQFRTLLLDAPVLELSGGGSARLGAETLALDLRGLVRVGGTGIAVPLRVGGSFRAPQPELVGPGPGGQGFSALLGALAPQAVPSCGPALAAAFGRAAPAEAAPDAAPAQDQPAAKKQKAPNLGDLLRGFTR